MSRYLVKIRFATATLYNFNRKQQDVLRESMWFIFPQFQYLIFSNKNPLYKRIILQTLQNSLSYFKTYYYKQFSKIVSTAAQYHVV